MVTIAAFIGRRRLRKLHQREQAAIDAFVLETCEGAVRTAKGMAL